MLRIATLDDTDIIFDMASKFISHSYYKDKTDPIILRKFIEYIVAAPQGVVILYEDKGMIAGQVTQFTFGEQNVASEICWWVEPEYRNTSIGKELLDAFEYWAKEKMYCEFITMVSLDDKIGKYYEKRGFHLAERTYMKELN